MRYNLILVVTMIKHTTLMHYVLIRIPDAILKSKQSYDNAECASMYKEC